MKLNIYSALLGALLISGSIHAGSSASPAQPPVDYASNVKEALKDCLPEGESSTDETLQHCLCGSFTNTFWAQKYINEILSRNSKTSQYTANHTSWFIPSIPTIASSTADDTSTKLLFVYNGNEVICGIKVFVKEGKIDNSEYIRADEAKRIGNRSSVSGDWSQWGNPVGLFWYPKYYRGIVLGTTIALTVVAAGVMYHNYKMAKSELAIDTLKSMINSLETEKALQSASSSIAGIPKPGITKLGNLLGTK